MKIKTETLTDLLKITLHKKAFYTFIPTVQNGEIMKVDLHITAKTNEEMQAALDILKQMCYN